MMLPTIPLLIVYTVQVRGTVEPLYYGHHWDRSKCTDYRGVLISDVLLYTKVTFEIPESVLIIEVSLLQSILVSYYIQSLLQSILR